MTRPRTTTTALFLLLVTAFIFVAITAAAITTSPPPHQKPLRLKLHHKHNHSDENYIHSKIKGDRIRRQKWLSAAKKASSTNHFTFGQELDTRVPVGTPFRDGEYAIYAYIGSQKSPQIFSLDTGSDEAWLQCEPCSRGCSYQQEGIYIPILSADSETVLYTDPVCGQVLDRRQGENNECLYNISYADGSFTAGHFTRDKITLIDRDDGTELFSAKIPIGCGDQNVGFHGISGVLPLSRGPLSLVTTFNLQSLSYCLGSPGWPSYIIFNNTSPPPNNGEDTVYLNLLRGVDPTETFLYVELTGIMVGSQVVPIPEGTLDLRPDGTGGGVILDTDSMLTYLTKKAYDPLEAALIAQTQTLTPVDPPYPYYKKCFVVTDGNQNIYPDIVFSFQQGQVQLSWGGYIVNVTRGIECFGILPVEDEDDDISILGNLSQRGIQFNYDFVQNNISMTFHRC